MSILRLPLLNNKLLAGFLLAYPIAAQATVVLAVDFGRNDSLAAGAVGTTGSRLESGFRPFYLSGNAVFSGVASLTYSGTDPAQTTGSVTVNLQGDASGQAGSLGGRNRAAPLDSGSFTYGDLLSDGIVRTKLTSTQGEFTLQLLGLQPSTTFSIRLWTASSGSDIDAIYSWYNTTETSSLIGTILNGPGSPLTASANTDFSVNGAVTSNSDGILTFGVLCSNRSPTAGFINGFELSTVPEPAASTMTAIAVVTALLRRRKMRGDQTPPALFETASPAPA